MKSIYLTRHAKSSWKDADLSDFERPLNSRGRSDAPKIGKYLSDQGVEVEEIVCSPANRAITTARFIADGIGFPKEMIRPLSNLYTFGDIQAAENEIYSMPDHKNSILIVGHNEWITQLANQLSIQNIGHMVTCAVIKLNFPFEQWTEIKPSSGKLEFHIYPKMLV